MNLEELVQSKTIQTYQLDFLDDNGEIGSSDNRNSERLTIYFKNGENIILTTFCSGSSQNSSFLIEA